MTWNRDRVLDEFLVSAMGSPYKWGGDDPILGFDCSGLVCAAFRQFFTKFPRTNSRGLPQQFQDLADCKIVDLDSNSIGQLAAEFGDTLYYHNGKGKIIHVSIALNNSFIIEAGGGNAETKTEAIAAKKNAYVRINPMAHRISRICKWVKSSIILY